MVPRWFRIQDFDWDGFPAQRCWEGCLTLLRPWEHLSEQVLPACSCLIVEGRSVAGAKGESASVIIGEQQGRVNLSPGDTAVMTLLKSGEQCPVGYAFWWTAPRPKRIFRANWIVLSLVRGLHVAVVFEVRHLRLQGLSSECSSQGARRAQLRSVNPAEQVP
jgi:hypothetical protein